VSARGKRLKVLRLTASVFYHATEDPVKVRVALLNLVPEAMRSSLHVDEDVVPGHFGDEIGIITLRLSGNEAFEALRYLICSLSETDRKILLATVENRVGSKPSHLHIRLSKQDAFKGRVALMDGDDIIKISATIQGVRHPQQLRKFLEGLIGGCS
jgi:RNA binding exosome subunit